jgi:hypothetical protein
MTIAAVAAAAAAVRRANDRSIPLSLTRWEFKISTAATVDEAICRREALWTMTMEEGYDEA